MQHVEEAVTIRLVNDPTVDVLTAGTAFIHDCLTARSTIAGDDVDKMLCFARHDRRVECDRHSERIGEIKTIQNSLGPTEFPQHSLDIDSELPQGPEASQLRCEFVVDDRMRGGDIPSGHLEVQARLSNDRSGLRVNPEVEFCERSDVSGKHGCAPHCHDALEGADDGWF